MQRKKTPLAPGHTLADWYKLIHSGVDMGGSGRLLRVTPEEVFYSIHKNYFYPNQGKKIIDYYRLQNTIKKMIFG
jgi:hypothetical protein